MKKRILHLHLVLLVTLSLILATPACASLTEQPGQPTKPIAVITAPQGGTGLTLGQEVLVTFTVADVKGISQVELSIDGQPVHVEKVDPPVNSFAASQPWTPNRPGSHVIELRAFNVDNEASDPAQVFVTVGEAAGAAAPPTSEETSTATLESSLLVTETPTATPIALIAPSTTPEPSSPTPSSSNVAMVTARVGVNVRTGPGLDYPVIGRLAEGQSTQITGRNANTTWWQIVYPLNSNERAWVSGDAQYTTASNAEAAPVVEAPPAPTPAPVTPTPVPARPVIHYFRVDRNTLNPGERAELSWDLAGAREAFLRYDDVTEGVVAPGAKTVSPSKTTVYTLLARNDVGDTTAEVTITVNAATATPVPVFRDGKTGLVHDQSIDFDQGVILSGAGGVGVDFYWDGQRRSFAPQNGAIGTLLGRTYSEITLRDCRDASYGQPISGIDGSTRITGCYRTNEGRYGRFFVSEWNAAGNLVIEWLTWDYR